MKTQTMIMVGAVVAVAAVAGYLYWQSKKAEPAPRPSTPATNSGQNTENWSGTATQALSTLGDLFG